MKCRDFEFDLSDWIAGRLAADRSARMQEHADNCRACSVATEHERSLRVAIAAVPPITRTPDLWLRISDRIAAPAARASWLDRLFPKPSRAGYGLSFASGLAVIAVCAVIFTHRSPVGGTSPTAGANLPPEQVDEARVVKLVADMQSVPEAGSEMGLATPPHMQSVERALGTDLQDP